MDIRNTAEEAQKRLLGIGMTVRDKRGNEGNSTVVSLTSRGGKYAMV